MEPDRTGLSGAAARRLAPLPAASAMGADPDPRERRGDRAVRYRRDCRRIEAIAHSRGHSGEPHLGDHQDRELQCGRDAATNAEGHTIPDAAADSQADAATGLQPAAIGGFALAAPGSADPARIATALAEPGPLACPVLP